MSGLAAFQSNVASLNLSSLLVVGVITGISYYFGKIMKYVKLPSIIGFMIIGVIFGPSLLNVLGDGLQENLSFITEIALGFVALSIGLELSFTSLKKQGIGIILIIIFESFIAFILVTVAIYLVTKDLPLALIFGGIAPASAPAGTVAVINEYKAKGSLTQALYAVVGFDDGLGIIIFGFCSAFAKNILAAENGESINTLLMILTPLKEIGLSLLFGFLLAFITGFLLKKIKDERGFFIIIFFMVLIAVGLSDVFHLSLILTNMGIGIVLVNTQQKMLLGKIKQELSDIMPLLFIMFFALAGANLHVSALPSLGLLGVVYILARSGGLISGSKLGALIGHSDDKIRKYLGLGILSQAGVAIGLALIVKHEFTPLGDWGAQIGAIVITTVTATCLIFEIVGPILTKIGLKKAGEITGEH